MTEWNRTGGLSVPSYEEVTAGQALPDSFVEISMKITGGGIPEGEEIKVQIPKLRLNQMHQLKLDVLEPEVDVEDWSWSDKVYRSPDTRLALNLDAAVRVDLNGPAYIVEYPVDGEWVTSEQ